MTGPLRKEHLALLLILAFAFAVRIVGVNFGLPHVYHADEPIIVHHAMAYGSGDFNPHFFKIPPLVSYLLFFIYGLYYLTGQLLGWFAHQEDFLRAFLSNPTPFYLLGRFVFGAMIGTASVFALYRLERKTSNAKALISAFLLASAFLHVRDSHYIYADIPLVFCLILCFFPIFDVLERGRQKSYVLFGILGGISVALKYNGVFIFIPFFLAHFFHYGLKISKDLIFSVLIALCVYAIANPFSIIDFHFFREELLAQASAEGPSYFLHHLTYSLTGGVGIPLLVLSLVGIFATFKTRNKMNFLIVSFIFAYYFILYRFSQSYDRYVLPLIPFVTSLAAEGLTALQKKIRLANMVLVIFVILIAFPPILKVFYSDRLFMEEDVRDTVREWVEINLPPDAKIAMDVPFYMPRLKPNVKQLEAKKDQVLSVTAPGTQAQLKRIELLLQEARHSKQPQYELYFLKSGEESEEGGFLFSKPVIAYDVEKLKKAGIQYVITSPIDPAFESRFYQDLEQESKLITRFTPYKDPSREWPIDDFPLTGGPFLWKELLERGRNGQIIKVYRLT